MRNWWAQLHVPPTWFQFTVKLWLRKVPNNLLFTAESTLGLLKTKEMITNLKELLIFNYILLVSCMSEMYQEQYGGNTYWWKGVNDKINVLNASISGHGTIVKTIFKELTRTQVSMHKGCALRNETTWRRFDAKSLEGFS